MRALLASEYFYPHWTGIAKAFEILAQDLIKQGYKVTVLTTQFKKDLALSEDRNGLIIKRSPYQFTISRTHYSFTALLDFLKEVIKNDVVVINSPHSNILFFTVLAKLFGKKVFIFHQGDLTLPRMTGSIIKNWIIERIFDVLTIPAFLLANKISTYTEDYARNSRTMKYFLYKYFSYIPFKKISVLSKKHSKEEYRVGFAGRFVEEKGFDILYQAMKRVNRVNSRDVQFVFAGEKNISYEPFFKSHKKLFESQKHVKYLGLLDKGALQDFYTSLDVFVVSSRSDCFPLTQIEAALSGIPLVCTNIPGARMLVKETNVGVLVEPNNPGALVDGILEVLKNKDKYLKNKNNVLSFLKKYEHFTIDS